MKSRIHSGPSPESRVPFCSILNFRRIAEGELILNSSLNSYICHMEYEEKIRLAKILLWDYTIPPEELLQVIEGKREHAGHYTRESIFIKMLESLPWFTVLKLLTPEEINALLTDEVINKLRFASLRRNYAVIAKRLRKYLSSHKSPEPDLATNPI